MIVFVSGNFDSALQILARKRAADGIDRALKIHQIAKPSSRRRFKLYLAERRRLRNQTRTRTRRAGAPSKRTLNPGFLNGV